MDWKIMIIWALVLFGAAMIVIGIMEFFKIQKGVGLESNDPRVLSLQKTQSIVDATSGLIYTVLGVLGVTKQVDLQIIYGLVFVVAIVKKVVDTGIKSKIYRINDED